MHFLELYNSTHTAWFRTKTSCEAFHAQVEKFGEQRGVDAKKELFAHALMFLFKQYQHASKFDLNSALQAMSEHLKGHDDLFGQFCFFMKNRFSGPFSELVPKTLRVMIQNAFLERGGEEFVSQEILSPMWKLNLMLKVNSKVYAAESLIIFLKRAGFKIRPLAQSAIDKICKDAVPAATPAPVAAHQVPVAVPPALAATPPSISQRDIEEQRCLLEHYSQERRKSQVLGKSQGRAPRTDVFGSWSPQGPLIRIPFTIAGDDERREITGTRVSVLGDGSCALHAICGRNLASSEVQEARNFLGNIYRACIPFFSDIVFYQMRIEIREKFRVDVRERVDIVRSYIGMITSTNEFLSETDVILLQRFIGVRDGGVYTRRDGWARLTCVTDLILFNVDLYQAAIMDFNIPVPLFFNHLRGQFNFVLYDGQGHFEAFRMQA